MKIYLIRHGESTSDVEDRYGGDYDDHLTEKGNNQALKLAKQLENKKIDYLYSSPRIRARETAEILKNYLKLNVQIVDEIREGNHYGILTGMIKKEAAKKHPDEVKMIEDRLNTIKGAEPYFDFRSRIIKALDKILNWAFAKDYHEIAIVTHGGPIRCIFREVLELGELEQLGDCALIELEQKNKNSNLELLSLSNSVKIKGR